ALACRGEAERAARRDGARVERGTLGRSRVGNGILVDPDNDVALAYGDLRRMELESVDGHRVHDRCGVGAADQQRCDGGGERPARDARERHGFSEPLKEAATCPSMPADAWRD